MSGPQMLLRLWFYITLPVFGGVAVAFGSEWLEFPALVALVLGGLFGYTAFRLAPYLAQGSDWPELVGAILFGTLFTAVIPVATGICFTITDRYGAFPSLLVSALVALASTAVVGALSAEKVPQQIGEIVFRGRARGGVSELSKPSRR